MAAERRPRRRCRGPQGAAAPGRRRPRAAPRLLAAAAPAPLLLAALLLAASPRAALAQFDDTSNFNFNAPSATSRANIGNAVAPTVTAGNIQLVSTGIAPVTWSLQKSADQSSVRVQAGSGQTATVNYLVRVTASGPVNQNSLPFQVTGNIVIFNPNSGLSVRFRQVTANIQMFAAPNLGSWANGFTGGPSTFPAVCNSFTVPPSGRIICTFNAPVAFAGTGQVTPVATFTDDYIVQAAGGNGNVQGIPVPISVPGNLNSEPCATVVDAFSGGRQPTQVTGNRPTSGTRTCDTQNFSYQGVFGPYKTTECGTFTVTNTATLTPSSGAGSAQTQSASVNVVVFGCDAAAAPAPAPPPAVAPPPAPPGFVPGTATTTFGDAQQPVFAQPYATLGRVQGQFTGGAQAGGGGGGGWTVTATQDPPRAISLRANGADTAAVTFSVSAAPAGGAAAAAAAAPAASPQAFVTGVVDLINPVGQAFAVQVAAVEIDNGVVMVGSGTATCPGAVLPAATVAGPGTMQCTFAVPVAVATPGNARARVVMPQLAQAVVTAPAQFAFAGGVPAAAAAAGGGSTTARATVDSTFAPAGFAYAPMTISGSGTRPATATEGGTFLTGPQSWTWALTLGPFPAGTFCGANSMSTVARVFPLTPGGQVDPSQAVAQSGTTLTVNVDCMGQAGATPTETYVPTGERR